MFKRNLIDLFVIPVNIIKNFFKVNSEVLIFFKYLLIFFIIDFILWNITKKSLYKAIKKAIKKAVKFIIYG